MVAISAGVSWLIAKFCMVTSRSSTTARNLGLLTGGAIGHNWSLSGEAICETQAETAQKSLLNERYQRGAEMLGSDVLAVRLGGIYALQRLAETIRNSTTFRIMKLFCAFVRNPTSDKNMADDPEAKVREDVQAVMDAIRGRSDARVPNGTTSEFLAGIKFVKFCEMSQLRTKDSIRSSFEGRLELCGALA